MDALIACPLPDDATADTTREALAIVTTQPDGTETREERCDVPVDGTTAPQVTAADIRQWVVKQLPIGTVGAPEARTIVNSKAVLWLNVPVSKDWGPLTIVQAGVKIRATLTSVHWNFGDGSAFVAPDAGKPYDNKRPCDAICNAYFGHTYQKATGSVAVTAQSFWKAEFSVNGGPYQPLPDPVPADASPPLPLNVVQAHSALITGD